MSQFFYLFLAFVFIGLNAFFVMAEFAMVKVRSTRLQILIKSKSPFSKMAMSMVKKLDAYLSVCQLGITLSSLGLGWIGEPAFARLTVRFFQNFNLEVSTLTVHSIAVTIAFSLISILHITIGELVPKSIAIRMAEKVCLITAPPMRIFYYLFYPFLVILNSVSNGILFLIGMRHKKTESKAHTVEELKLIVQDSFEEGTIAGVKKDLLDKALDFSKQKVGDIKIPLKETVFLYLNKSLYHNLEIATEQSYTRFPLLDREDGVVMGYIHMKDVIWGVENTDLINMYDMIRPLIYFNEKISIDKALIRFRKERIHIAMVQNDDLKITGMITLEDVMEELVGEIEDEFDEPN